VEGFMDVIALDKAGFDNAVATCGTALTPNHISLLKRITPNVVFSFDSDQA
jgi:DNA primase